MLKRGKFMVKTRNKTRITALTACSVLLAASVAGGFAALPVGAASDSNSYTVDLARGLQEFDGWGLSLSWWATELGDWTRTGSSGKEKREEILEALYGESGLNLNIARYNIGGGDDPTHTHMTDDRNTPGWRGASQNGNSYTPNARYYFQDVNGNDIAWENLATSNPGARTDVRQLWVLDWIQNYRKQFGDLNTEFYSNSPPYWMTITGCSSGGPAVKNANNSNLKDDDEHNQAFVEYFLDVYEYLTRQGFTFDNLQPFNESGDYSWSEGNDQEGAHFEASQKVEILSILRREMAERGIDIAYNWGDEENTGTANRQYDAAIKYTTRGGESGADIVNGADRFTYHIYGSSIDDGDSMQDLYRDAKANGQQIYMSEITYTQGDKYEPTDMGTGFAYVNGIIETVKYGGVEAFVFWQGMEDLVGQIKTNKNYGLLQGVYYTQEEAEAQGIDLASMGLAYQDFVLPKAYYMSGQYTRYIKPGYRILDINDADSIAAVSPDGNTLVVVKRNSSSSGVNFSLDLKGFNAQSVEKIVTDKNNDWKSSYISTNGSSIVDTVNESSVTTYVITGARAGRDGRYMDDVLATKKNSLADIKSALTAGGDSEQFYATYDINGGRDGKSYYYFGSTSNQSNGGKKWEAIRFYGTGFGLSFAQKSDAGTVSIWVDQEPSDENATSSTTVNLKTDSPIRDIAYENTTMSEGWHTVYARSDTGWVNFDGVFIFTAKDSASNTPLSITNAAGLGNEISFDYTATGYDAYTIYAETKVGNTGWVRSSALSNGHGSVTVDNAGTVRLRLAAVKESEVVYSPEQVVTMLKTAEGVLYYVDCGTATPNELAAGAVLGELQSVSDKANGADPISGYSWGYTNTFSEAFWATGEAMSSMWPQEKANDKSTIEYKFTIPTAGTYNVALGFFGGTATWGSRTQQVKVGNNTQQDVTLNESTYTAYYCTVTTSNENEEITITVGNSGQNAFLSAIVITEENVAIPLYTSGASNFNSEVATAKKAVDIGGDLYDEVKKETFTVYLSNNTTQNVTYSTASSVTVNTPNIVVGEKIKVTFTANDYSGLEMYTTYTWSQEGAQVLYYNIDCGYTSSSGAPDDKTEKGIYQSTTADREYGADDGYSWGYDGAVGSCHWENNGSNEWSIREGKNGSLTYKMTGFKPNESLIIEICGHNNKGWGARSYKIVLNGSSEIGTISEPDDDTRVKLLVSDGEDDKTVKAAADGTLTVKCEKTSGGDPHVAYIKVWSKGETKPSEGTIAADQTTVARDSSVNLRNLTVGANVYILDENNNILGNFVADAATKTIAVADYLPETSYELHFTQAVANGTNPSTELIVDVPGIDILQLTGRVKNGDAAVILFTPHAAHGVTSLTVETPYGVTTDVSGDFFYRAKTNGEYKVTIVSKGVTYSTTFTVDNIDVIDFGETISETDWTDGPVTITLNIKTEEWSGIESLTVNEEPKEGEAGVYTITANENGVYTVVLKTTAGFTYTKVINISNIDTSTPELELEFNFDVASGVTLTGDATTQSGGTLYVTFNEEDPVAVPDLSAISLERAGKYVIYFVSGTKKQTNSITYYVTYDMEQSELAETITLGEDGTVTVTGDGITHTLYRAGETTAVTKATKAGKYYIELKKDGETEIVVFNIAVSEPDDGDITPPTQTPPTTTTTPKKNNSAVMIAGIVIGVVAIVAAAVVCTMLYLKGRKKS